MLKTFSCAAFAAAIATFQPAPANAQGGGDAFLGELILFGTNWCPRGWAAANGQLLPISSNTALFSLLGCNFGGDCRTTFALPDLRGRAPISFGQGPGLSNYALAERVGVESVTLNVTQIPSHNHQATSTGQLNASDGALNSATAAGAALANQPQQHYAGRGALDEVMEDGSVTVTTTVGNTGGNLSHETRAPRLAMQWCIATVGVFPSRN